VADGAGTAALGEAGAAIAAQTAIDALARCLPSSITADCDADLSGLLTDVLETARAAVESEAADRDVPARELATTLIVALAAPGLVAAAQVGDGAAVCLVDGELHALTAPQQGEYANDTCFLVSPGALAAAEIVLRRETCSHLAVFSDGLQRLALKLPEGAPHPQFFAPLFRFVSDAADEEEAVRHLADFLVSPRVRERTDDDLTLLLAARLG